jgi:hypothetical protein
MSRWFEDHSLSLSFAALFIATIAGQSIAGHGSYNSTRDLYGLGAVDYVAYLRTGNFLDGIFANWQAALLQLGCLIVFGKELREKGAAHSRKPKEEEGNKTGSKEEGKDRPWIYRNSLSLAFAVLFGMSFTAHLCFGTMKYNERLQMMHRPSISQGSYSVTSAFWFSNLQTWEAEFAAIAIYVVLSIFLREQGSPESKPVNSSKKETGETNH